MPASRPATAPPAETIQEDSATQSRPVSLLEKAPQATPLTKTEKAWEKDALGHKGLGEHLTRLVASAKGPIVLSLNAPYGMGKTHFILNWRKHLDEEGYKTVLFNAWETDYADNALAAFILEMGEQIEEIAPDLAKITAKGALCFVKDKAWPVAKAVGRVLTPFVNLVASTALPKGSPLSPDVIVEECGKLVEGLRSIEKSDLSGLAKIQAKEITDMYKATRESVRSFKKSFEEIIKKATEESPDEKKKLIVFVDELDRCRPSYAIEVLECIKHLFNIPGLVFVLALDEKQLAASIAKTYGALDAPPYSGEGYLRKFIDWPIHLPEPSIRKFATMLCDHFGLDAWLVREEANDRQISWNVINGMDSMIDAICAVAGHYKYSLREIGLIFTDINLYIRTLEENQPVLSFCLGLLASLRLRMPKEELKEYCEGKRNIEKTAFAIGSTAQNDKEGQKIKFGIEGLMMSHKNFESAENRYHVASNAGTDQEEIVARGPDMGAYLAAYDYRAMLRLSRSRPFPPERTLAWPVFCHLEKIWLYTSENS